MPPRESPAASFYLEANRGLWYLGGMKIDRNTTQEQLMKVTDAALLRDFLRGTPLNLKAFFRIGLLFMLFPGMLLGFRIGMLITGLFAAGLMGCLFWGQEEWGVQAVRWWLITGMVLVVCVSIYVTITAWKQRRKRELFLAADASLPAAEAVRDPQELLIRWREEEGRYVANLVLDIPVRGLYAYLITVEDFEGDGLGTNRAQEACFSQGEGKPSLRYNQFFVYRFEAGLHELSWYTTSLKGGEPHAIITQLNEVT